MGNYDFGEKDYENINGRKLPVGFKTPKFEEAKKKAIELLDSGKYNLLPSDFWILINTYSKGEKVMYSGLIISHDGCLKINDNLEDNLKYKPECISVDKDGFNNSLVYTYNCQEQGIYEVGEVSANNCKNGYPYAMALKRCQDRVILKNSKIAFSGIYSDVESDDFKQRNEIQKQKDDKKNQEMIDNAKNSKIDQAKINVVVKKVKELEIDEAKILETYGINTYNEMTVENFMDFLKICEAKEQKL